MTNKSDKNVGWGRRVLRSKVFLVFAIIILVILGLFLGRVIHKKYEVSQEIRNIKERKEGLVKENERLQDLLEYLKTDTYKDRVAREDLGLQREGETVVVISEGEDVIIPEEQLLEKQTEGKELVYVPTYRKWWDYFFASKD
ncbi:septum formation initiator family protein [Patescibacteria group bacterium]